MAAAEYEKGREYLNKADRLLAQLDGAKHTSQNSQALIDELIAKAERLKNDLGNVMAEGNMDEIDSDQMFVLFNFSFFKFFAANRLTCWNHESQRSKIFMTIWKTTFR